MWGYSEQTSLARRKYPHTPKPFQEKGLFVR